MRITHPILIGFAMLTTCHPSPPRSFDANGNVVVSVGGDEDTSAIYVTVDVDTDPADPTVSVNDGSIVGRTGVIETGVKIPTGSVAHVKIVGADAGGNLGPVRSSRRERRIGPFAKDTTDRSHTGNVNETVLEEVTIPAGTLGANGALRVYAHWRVDNTSGLANLRVRLGSGLSGTLIANFSVPISLGPRSAIMRLLVFNDGADDVQESLSELIISDENAFADRRPAAIATDSDQDLVFSVALGNSADEVTLSVTMTEFIGTD